LNVRLVVLGVVLILAGGGLIALPQEFSPPTTVSDRTTLAQISPGNYTHVQMPLSSQSILQATFASSPGSVDFFLMNSSTFSTWSKGHPSVDVYPQSQLNVKNYSFTFTNTDPSGVYDLVMVSRSNSSSTDVLLHLVVQQNPALLETIVIPGVLVALGLVAAAIGATRKTKAKEAKA
jgi:hypothetical protein